MATGTGQFEDLGCGYFLLKFSRCYFILEAYTCNVCAVACDKVTIYM